MWLSHGVDEYLLPPINGWREWGAIFTQTERWRSVIDRVWATPSIKALTGVNAIGRIEAGFPGTCAVFIIDEQVVIKFFPPMVADDWDKERAVYRLLADRPIEIPRLLAGGVLRDRQAWPYLITTYRPGIAWRDARASLPPSQRMTVAWALGRRLRFVHDTDIPRGAEWPPDDAWPRYVNAQLAVASKALRESSILPDRTVAAAERLLADTDWFEVSPRLLHGDMTEDHVLVAEHDGAWRINGLIDWADAEVGDPCYEWVALYFGFCGGDTNLFRVVLAGYELESGRLPGRRRLLAFTLLHRFGVQMITDRLGEEVIRGIDDLDRLAGWLFPGFDG